MNSDDEDYNNSEVELDEDVHNTLVENVLNLSNKQHVKKPSRTEPTLKISEFDLVKTSKNVKLNDLAKLLKSKGKHVQISKEILQTENTKTLQTPLEKPAAERIRRSIAYENTKQLLKKWDPIITSNRAAEILKFPLRKDLNLKDNKSLPEFRLKSNLQMELEKLEPEVEVYNVDIEEAFPLTMTEILEKRNESAKLRAQQSYREAKAKRQSKIKSKKYHRIMKREKIKEKLKEFELLQKTDPQAAYEKLEEIEKARAVERMSLRHKGTGQWAKSKQFRAKYDRESRQALAQQLSLSRDLTQKIKPNEDSESETEEMAVKFPKKYDKSNPWISNVKTSEEVENFVSSYRKYWEEKNNITTTNTKNKEIVMPQKQINRVHHDEELPSALLVKKSLVTALVVESPNEKTLIQKKKKKTKSLSTTDWEVTETNVEKVFNKINFDLRKKLDEKYKKIKKGLNFFPKENTNSKKSKQNNDKEINLNLNKIVTKPIIDEELMETTNGEYASNMDMENIKNLLKNIDDDKIEKNIDPNKFIQAKTTKLISSVPDFSTYNDEDSDPDQRDAIIEAFEDDDIVDEFRKDKQNDIDKNNPKIIDLNLPGWGSWGGKDIKILSRKNKRLITRFPKQLPRKDSKKGLLIINEDANAKLKPLMVSEIPFPFTTVKDYEASIRQPVGNTFVPENAFRKLIQPSVITKIGEIIEPMSHDVLLKTKKKRK